MRPAQLSRMRLRLVREEDDCFNRAKVKQALLVLALFGLLPEALATSSPPDVTAVSANDFLDSIGTLSAIAARGETLQKTIECTQYLGVRWLRAGIEGHVPIDQLVRLHNEAHVRFSWGFGSGSSDLAKLIAT